MPFAKFKVPQTVLSNTQREETICRTTSMFAKYSGKAVRSNIVVLIEEVPDGGYGRADEASIIFE